MIDSMTASPDLQHLTVTWDNGEESTLSAACLRREAKDAWSIRERIDHGGVSVAPEIRITAMQQMGQAVNLHFSDGHEKAIYPFVYLRELADMHDK